MVYCIKCGRGQVIVKDGHFECLKCNHKWVKGQLLKNRRTTKGQKRGSIYAPLNP